MKMHQVDYFGKYFSALLCYNHLTLSRLITPYSLFEDLNLLHTILIMHKVTREIIFKHALENY